MTDPIWENIARRARANESVAARKAVTSLGPWGTGIPLSNLGNTPQAKAAACLRAYKVGWFYKAGSKIADDVASLDWSLSEGDAEEGQSETTLDRPDLRIPFETLSPIDQFQRLLERPNPYQTGRQLLRKTEVRLDFAGAACWWLEGATTSLPTGIYGINPARMWPSRDKAGNLIGWLMDADTPNPVPFDTSEIVWFSTGNAEADDDIWGVSVVEAVYSQVGLTDLMARNTSNVLATGGRLAGMMWPKERALSEDEFTDAQRAWRNVASDPDAGRRLLIFPEPMEYANGAATPADIGIPELAVLNRDEILTAFPISPYMLGVPTPGGLNSGEVRAEERKDYWEGTIHPRADLIEEVIQVSLLSKYEEATGQTYDFEIAEPDMDDAAALTAKATAFKDLVGIGLDPAETLKAVGLGHIKFLGLPAILDPVQQQMMAQQRVDALANQPEQTPRQGEQMMGKSRKEQSAAVREAGITTGQGIMASFFAEQRARVTEAIRTTLGPVKARDRKADPDLWWDETKENEELKAALGRLYVEVGRGSLQVVADSLERIVANRQVRLILEDLLRYGGDRIVEVNANTKAALARELAEGVRRGYSVNQLIDGVPAEGFGGVQNSLLDNGVAVWDDLRAETIARTETMLSYNRAAVTSYKDFGIGYLLAYDGDGDAECAARDGHEFPVDEALGIEDHPNGTLDWAPVLDKARHEEPPAPIVQQFILSPDGAMKALTQPPVVNVEATDLEPVLDELKALREDIAHLPAPVVEAPIVNVEPPIIKSLGVQDVRIVESTLPKRKRTVKRDLVGRITEITED